MKQWAPFFFGSCFWKVLSVIGIKGRWTWATGNLRLISRKKKMMLLENVCTWHKQWKICCQTKLTTVKQYSVKQPLIFKRHVHLNCTVHFQSVYYWGIIIAALKQYSVMLCMIMSIGILEKRVFLKFSLHVTSTCILYCIWLAVTLPMWWKRNQIQTLYIILSKQLIYESFLR